MDIYDGSADKRAMPTTHTIEVVSTGRITVRHSGMTVRRHGREDFSLFFCETGRILLDDGAIGEGECLIIPPNCPQKYTVLDTDGTVYRYLHFTGTDVSLLLSSLGIPVGDVFPFPSGARELFFTIDAAASEGTAVGDTVAEYSTLRLLTQLASSEEHTDRREGLLYRVTDEMAHAYFLPYDVGRYAELLGVSEGRFQHLFKEEMGVSPGSYYIDLRIRNACRLLRHTDMSVTAVAENVGYDDPLYFGRIFARRMGMSPRAYRKMQASKD